MIIIPSKADKQRSTLVDGLRIMAWTMHKSTNKLNGPAAYSGYPAFEDEWKKHEIHSFDLKGVQKYIKNLGYTDEEVLQQRSQYYERKYNLNKTQDLTQNSVDAPSPFDGNTPEFVDEFEYPEPPY
jgi:hypothetical protein